MPRPISRCVAAVLGALAVAGSAAAHEHMYIAATARKGGQLVLEYDFTRAFPLAELPNQPGTWISVDPSFNSLVADAPDQSRYRLKNGTTVSMELVAIDASASVLLGGKTLDAPGDRAVAGKMPYLHVHPQWTLTLPVGQVGEAHLSFRVRAPGYKPSSVYDAVMIAAPPPTTTTTSTTTTTGDGSTTTSTAFVCTAVTCDDHDFCTADLCDGPVCSHVVAVEGDAVLCKLRALQSVLDQEQPATRKARRLLGRLYGAVTKARSATQTAKAGGTPKQFVQVGRKISRLTTFIDAADRAGTMDPTRITELQDLATTAYDALTLWQTGP